MRIALFTGMSGTEIPEANTEDLLTTELAKALSVVTGCVPRKVNQA